MDKLVKKYIDDAVNEYSGLDHFNLVRYSNKMCGIMKKCIENPQDFMDQVYRCISRFIVADTVIRIHKISEQGKDDPEKTLN